MKRRKKTAVDDGDGEDDDGDDDGPNVRCNISFNLGKRTSLNRASNASIGRKKRFSTETGFERGKTAEISKVYRLIIITNVLER